MYYQGQVIIIYIDFPEAIITCDANHVPCIHFNFLQTVISYIKNLNHFRKQINN